MHFSVSVDFTTFTMMALHYERSGLLSIFSTISVSQPLSSEVWRNLENDAGTRIWPTQHGCRAGRMKRRSTPTRIPYSRQDSGNVLYF